MPTKWDNLFGSGFLLTLTNEERRYLGLNPLDTKWDTLELYSKTNYWHKRTTVFFDNDVIIKVIYESKKIVNEEIRSESISEYDANIQTENRTWVLPLTERGKKKKLNATSISPYRPTGCIFGFGTSPKEENSSGMSVVNCVNNKHIAMGETEKIRKIKNDAEFHSFMKYYMETCPEDYFDRIKELRESKHVTIKYNTGDIFRAEVDRFRYTYGIITGKVRKIRKWKELPKYHSLRNVMMVPILVRFYDIFTTDATLTAEDLADLPLSRIKICGDNDIIWGTHKIVSHKELQEDDIEFNLFCQKLPKSADNSKESAYETLSANKYVRDDEPFNLYIEWGTASTILLWEDMTQDLKDYFSSYFSPHRSVATSVSYYDLWNKNSSKYKDNLLNDVNKEIREKLFECLQLKADAGFDDFSEKFGGLTKKEIISRL